MIIAATGHRPDKLGGYSPLVFDNLVFLAKMYLEAEQPEHAISGMALGWDQAFATAALHLGIPFTAAVPFKGFEDRWPAPSRIEFDMLLGQAAKVVYVSQPGYEVWKMQRRNDWMVDNCHHLCALSNGSLGGTSNCIFYAERVGRPVTNLWPQYMAFLERGL
jgi:uncharacterized phage-like protein YoqJ